MSNRAEQRMGETTRAVYIVKESFGCIEAEFKCAKVPDRLMIKLKPVSSAPVFGHIWSGRRLFQTKFIFKMST